MRWVIVQNLWEDDCEDYTCSVTVRVGMTSSTRTAKQMIRVPLRVCTLLAPYVLFPSFMELVR